MSGAFGEEFERALSEVWQLARNRGHGYVTLEHLVLAILNEPTSQGLFREHEIALSVFQDELLEFIDRHTPRTGSTSQKVEETRSVSRVQARAQMIFEIPTGVHVLEMLFEEPQSHAVQLLRKHGLDRDQVSQFRVRMDRVRFGAQEGEGRKSPQRGDPMEVLARSKVAMEHCAIDLNERVKAGAIDALIGRQNEINQMIRTLGRRRKNNVVLVGEAGVGKTALAEGLAWRIVQGDVPKNLAASTVLSLNVGNLVAGTRFRGDFEERMKNFLNSLKKRPDTILFIDEIHMLVGAGSASGMAMDAADQLKPLLTTEGFRCIGATTHREFRQIFEQDSALARRFRRIEVEEPSIIETYQILEGLKESYEKHHQVTYGEDVIRAIVDLSAKYLHDRQLPDKAVDLMDETGSGCRLEPDNPAPYAVQIQDVERTVATMARIPERSVSTSSAKALLDLDQRLKALVFGQDESIDQLAQAIKVSRASLKPEQRPMGAFLFSGPTGVGKTEVCRQLAEVMSVELLRFDMSEYMERQSVARLIGAPPGYVGYDEGGLLTEAVMQHPYAVLLLDEVEKAHPDVMNVLLQVMDYGKLTDSNGRAVDFRNLLLVMTCNVGAGQASRASMGFTPQDHGTDIQREIERAFAPEFRNRLDAIVQFAPLDEESILAVVGKFLGELQDSLREQAIWLKADIRARRWLAKEGFDPVMGARCMERVMRDQIRVPLADKILCGTLSEGGTVRLTANKAGLRITVESTEEDVPATVH
ncbi:MAG: AAA family ATPase [Gammaproteobacteria bacterium]|nr:AAA family ATPase [Gammaproteobacteria bacterium]